MSNKRRGIVYESVTLMATLLTTSIAMQPRWGAADPTTGAATATTAGAATANTTSATSSSLSPSAGTSAYAYHLDGDLKNSGTAGEAGNLKDDGFASFVPSGVGDAFGKAGFDSGKTGHNHLKVPLSSLTNSDGSFTVTAVFQFPENGVNADPNTAKFTLASYGGETDGGANTAGGGFYLNFNADPELAGKIDAAHHGSAGRIQFVVDNRVRGNDNGFSRAVLVNALVPVKAEAGKAYRATASWNNVTGVATVGWDRVAAGEKPQDTLQDTLSDKTGRTQVSGQKGLVINGTRYFLTVGGAEAEDGGNGFAAANVKIDDVAFIAGVQATAPTTQAAH